MNDVIESLARSLTEPTSRKGFLGRVARTARSVSLVGLGLAALVSPVAAAEPPQSDGPCNGQYTQCGSWYTVCKQCYGNCTPCYCSGQFIQCAASSPGTCACLQNQQCCDPTCPTDCVTNEQCVPC
jgi:hypothetical protein